MAIDGKFLQVILNSAQAYSSGWSWSGLTSGPHKMESYAENGQKISLSSLQQFWAEQEALQGMWWVVLHKLPDQLSLGTFFKANEAFDGINRGKEIFKHRALTGTALK